MTRPNLRPPRRCNCRLPLFPRRPIWDAPFACSPGVGGGGARGAAAAPVELRARVERLTSLGVDVALVARAGIDTVDPRLRAPRHRESHVPAALRRRRGLRAGARRTAPDRPSPRDRRRRRAARRRGRAVRDALHPEGVPSRVGGGRPRPQPRAVGRPPADDCWTLLIDAGIGGWSDLVELAGSLAHSPGVPRPCVSWRDGRLELRPHRLRRPPCAGCFWIVRCRDYDAREVLVVGAKLGLDGGAGGTARRLVDPRAAQAPRWPRWAPNATARHATCSA